jgi:hypothetical protein
MGASPYRLKDDPHSSHSVILARLGDGRGRKALDVGAADGFLSERLTAQGWSVTALERDPALAARAHGRCKEVVVADLEAAPPLLNGPFAAIVYGAVLAPGGTVVVSVPNVAHLWVRLSLGLGRFDYADRGILDRTHLRFFTRRTFVAFLRDAGLTVAELRATPVPLPLVVPPRWHGGWLRGLHGLSALAARAWPRGLAYQFVAVCRRAPEAA